MSDITYRSAMTRDLMPSEVDANFRSLDNTKTEKAVTEAIDTRLTAAESTITNQGNELVNHDARLDAAEQQIGGQQSELADLDTRLDAVEPALVEVTALAEGTQQALDAHQSSADPHAQYALDADLAAHAAASDPHAQYLLKSDFIIPPAPASVDVQAFTASGTYVKPAGAKSIHLLLIGGGGGGDSGQVTNPGSWALGGKSGGGGAVFMATIDASVVADSVAVTIGAGGIGGAPSASSTANYGTAGSDTGFGAFYCEGASIADSPGLSYTSGMFHGGLRVRPNSTGGPSASRDSLSVVNGGFAVGMPPGSSGAGISDADVVSANGGFHHFSLMVYPGNLGSSPGNLDGNDARAYLDGSSGAGGGASDSANGADGGHGGNYGTGGGGGGAARTGFMSGRGGDGAPGVAVITTYF